LTEWRIRVGDRGDVRRVLALWREAESVPSATDSEQALGRLLDQDPNSLLLAEAADEIVGSLIVGWDGWRASFYRLAVHPSWRRRGIATGLVRTGEARLEKLGAIRLTAIVATEEVAAMSLWHSMGYTRQGDRSRFVRVLDPNL
jgi:ribosomal protein S18 acetylase RimI-like enzyme